jgi:hypothetical protein
VNRPGSTPSANPRRLTVYGLRSVTRSDASRNRAEWTIHRVLYYQVHDLFQVSSHARSPQSSSASIRAEPCLVVRCRTGQWDPAGWPRVLLTANAASPGMRSGRDLEPTGKVARQPIVRAFGELDDHEPVAAILSRSAIGFDASTPPHSRRPTTCCRGRSSQSACSGPVGGSLTHRRNSAGADMLRARYSSCAR